MSAANFDTAIKSGVQGPLALREGGEMGGGGNQPPLVFFQINAGGGWKWLEV